MLELRGAELKLRGAELKLHGAELKLRGAKIGIFVREDERQCVNRIQHRLQVVG